MAKAYYISSINVPGAARFVERRLADQARNFVGKIITKSAVEVWAKDLKEQIPLLASKNMKVPEISSCLWDDDHSAIPSYLHIGCVSVALQPIMGEVKDVKGELVWN